jgi:uncharacterized membrane protein YedE/YeeE
VKTHVKTFIALLIGVLFGAGLVISGMSNPANVLNFLDLAAIPAGRWDARLIFVMGGGVLVTAIGFPWLMRRARPIFADKFAWPTSSVVDRRLVIGAALFGFGWGLAGYCPGPAFANIGASIGTGIHDMLFFIPAMLVGMWAATKFR